MLVWMSMFGMVALVVGVTHTYQQGQKKRRAESLKNVADRHGLEFSYSTSGEGLVVGRVEGVPVTGSVVMHKQGKSQVAWIQFEATSAVPLPNDLALYPQGLGSFLMTLIGGQDIEVGDPTLDHRAVIRAAEPGHVQDLFENDRLRVAVRQVFTNSPHNQIENGHVLMASKSFDKAAVGSLLDTVVEAALAFEDALVSPWIELAGREGFELEQDNGVMKLVGTDSNGVHCQLTGSFTTGKTVVRVTTPYEVTASLRIVSGQHSGARELGDPILDGRVSATGDALDRLKQLLCTDSVRGELMEVLQRFPESRVEGRTVVLACNAATFSSLSARLTDASRLAVALGERAEALRTTSSG